MFVVTAAGGLQSSAALVTTRDRPADSFADLIYSLQAAANSQTSQMGGHSSKAAAAATSTATQQQSHHRHKKSSRVRATVTEAFTIRHEMLV